MSYLPSNTVWREKPLGCKVRRAPQSKQKKQSPTQPSNEPWQHRNDSHLVTVSSNGSSSSIFLFEKAKDKPKGLGFDLAVERLHYSASSSWREVSPVICRSWKRLIMAIERGPGSGGNAKKGEEEPDRKGLSLLLSPAPLATQQHHLLVRDRLRRRWKGPLIPGEGSCTPLS